MPAGRINLFVDGQRLDDAVLSGLARLEVRESDAEPGVAALRFELSQASDGRWLPLDEAPFALGDRLAVELAAPGGLPQRLFDGCLSHLRPHFETIERNCYLELLAMDAALLLDAEERVTAYPDATDAEAAEEIFERHGLSAVVETTPSRVPATRRLLVQRGTDWQFLRLLARRNGFCCYLEYDQDQEEILAYFRPPALDGDPQADLRIQREGANLDWADFQLLAVGPMRTVGAAIDPVLKRLVRSDGETDQPLLGEEGLAEDLERALAAHPGVECVSALLRDPCPDEAGIAAQGAAQSARDRLVVELRGQLDPALYRGLLRARRPVLVSGAGERFSGIYYVERVRTTLDGGRLSQTFVARRNALGQSGREPFGQDAEEVPPA